MTNNKEEILEKNSTKMSSGQFVFSSKGIYKAMDEYAKQVAIEFAKKLNIDYTDKDSTGKWLDENQWRKMNTDDVYTTEQLYSLWEQTKK